VRTRAESLAAKLACLGVFVLAYYAVYPEDVAVVVDPAAKILSLSFAVSPWLYAVIGVAILAWAAVRIWGRAPTVSTARESPPIQ